MRIGSLRELLSLKRMPRMPADCGLDFSDESLCEYEYEYSQ